MTESGQGDHFSVHGLSSEESPQPVELARRLEEERALPSPAFRAALRRTLLEDQRERALARGRARLQIAAYGCSGGILLAIAALGVSGIGPLAPG
jgi:hypothetical protein